MEPPAQDRPHINIAGICIPIIQDDDPQVAEDQAAWWMIIDPDRDSPLTQFSTREQALSTATFALQEVRGGRLEIADENGVHELGPVSVVKRPWWQATRTPRAGLLLGLLWLGLFILRLTTDERPSGWHYETISLVLPGTLAALYLSSSILLLLRRRRAQMESARR